MTRPKRRRRRRRRKISTLCPSCGAMNAGVQSGCLICGASLRAGSSSATRGLGMAGSPSAAVAAAADSSSALGPTSGPQFTPPASQANGAKKGSKLPLILTAVVIVVGSMGIRKCFEDSSPPNRPYRSITSPHTSPVMPRQAASQVSGSVRVLKVDHNAVVNGAKGMLIHADVVIRNHQGRQAMVEARFFATNGAPLRDFDQRYRASDGTVHAGEVCRPATNAAQWRDFRLFLPYDQLHLRQGMRHELSFELTVRDKSQNTPFASSPRQKFWVNW